MMIVSRFHTNCNTLSANFLLCKHKNFFLSFEDHSDILVKNTHHNNREEPDMSQNKYYVEEPVQNAQNAQPKRRGYEVMDDAAIRNAGFTDTTTEEQRLKDELNKYSTKSVIACQLLSLIHCHYFYVGRMGRGLLCLCTCNFLFVGMIIDLVIITCGKFKDKHGRLVSPMRLKAEMDLQNYYRQQAGR